MRILVSPRSLTRNPHPALDKLTAGGYEVVLTSPGQQPDEAELIARLPGCVGWIAGVEPVSPAAIAAATDLRAISRNGTGIDNLPMDLLRARGIAVLRAEGRNANGVAELTLGLMLESLRYIAFSHGGLQQAEWRRRLGRELSGLTVGIVGCGAIGSRVARLCASFGANILVHDPWLDPARLEGIALRQVGLDDLLAASDVISLHCAPPAGGGALLDAVALARLRAGARLINTARAALVDHDAVLAALISGQLAAFATDVFDAEPPVPSPLFQHPGCIVTAHIGGYTEQSVDSVTHVAVDNLLEALSWERAAR